MSEPPYPAASGALATAQFLIEEDRRADYGDARIEFARVAQLWTALLGDRLRDGAEITARDVPRLMIALKLQRDTVTPKPDNVDDVIGYAALMAEV